MAQQTLTGRLLTEDANTRRTVAAYQHLTSIRQREDGLYELRCLCGETRTAMHPELLGSRCAKKGTR